MIFAGRPGFIFKSITGIKCSFNGRFNVLLQSDNVVAHHNKIEELTFVVPTGYKYFVKAHIKKTGKVGDLFEFENESDRIEMEKYVKSKEE